MAITKTLQSTVSIKQKQLENSFFNSSITVKISTQIYISECLIFYIQTAVL
ncbi:hypothetical protein LEP1GSC088_1465 [Leptospira interrogans str. L1207]|nr:hypothetical protein LEP1GSC088_1465 [Leptospira interrogans str. L1207]